MSDGMSDGYRMELEARDRDKRMSQFGTEKCFYCGQKVDGGGFRSEEYDSRVHRHLSGHESIPDRVWFCSETCWGFWGKVKETMSSVRLILEGGASPALRMSVRKFIVEAVGDTEVPRV